MTKNKKIILGILIFVSVIVFLLSILIVSIHILRNRNDYNYDDDLIIGRNVTAIIDTYGEFEHTRRGKDGTIGSGWYILKEASGDILLGSEYPKYYIIVFEDEIAVRAYEYHGLYTGG